MTDSWWSHRTRAMGSDVELRVLGAGGSAGEAVARRVTHLLALLERCWSRFDAGSDLTRLNDDPRAEVEVPVLLAAAVHRAVLAWTATGGAVDPTVHDALVAAGYDRSFELLADRCVAPAPGTDVPGCAAVEVVLDDAVDLLAELDGGSGATALVRRPPGLRLDLGGIGKGLAADLVAMDLVASGARSVHVSLGGDVRVAGEAPDGGWPVPVTDPWDGTRLVEVVLDRPGAVVMSSTRRRRWQTRDGGWAHHLIDPATGRPAASGVAAVVAVAEEAWWAESLAKAALVLGVERGAALLRRHGAEGVVLADDTEQVSCWRTASASAGVSPAGR